MKAIATTLMIVLCTLAAHAYDDEVTPEQAYLRMTVIYARHVHIHEKTLKRIEQLNSQLAALEGEVFIKTKTRAINRELIPLKRHAQAQELKLAQMKAYMDAYAKTHGIGQSKASE